jgi:hypothetical protein
MNTGSAAVAAAAVGATVGFGIFALFSAPLWGALVAGSAAALLTKAAIDRASQSA